MCMVSLYLLAILCCHTIDWDIFLRYWCLSQIYYYYIIIKIELRIFHQIVTSVSFGHKNGNPLEMSKGLFDGFGKFQTPHTVIFYHLSIHQFQ